MQAKESNSVENPTRHKVQEGEYFLSMMKQAFENDNTFSYNLSAFLSAARSITDYIKKQYAHRNGFAEWYCPYQMKMFADSEFKYLKKVRDEDVHTEVVQTGATRELSVGMDAVFVEKGTPMAAQAKEAKPKPPAQSSQKTVRRFFPELRQVDVI